MTIEERLARLEVRADVRDAQLAAMDAKLDAIIAAANMGRGAWILLLKLGAVVGAVITAAVWVWNQIPHK